MACNRVKSKFSKKVTLCPVIIFIIVWQPSYSLVPLPRRAHQKTKKTISVRFTFHEKNVLKYRRNKNMKVGSLTWPRLRSWIWNTRPCQSKYLWNTEVNRIVKFRYSEKATKIWNNLTIYLNSLQTWLLHLIFKLGLENTSHMKFISKGQTLSNCTNHHM